MRSELDCEKSFGRSNCDPELIIFHAQLFENSKRTSRHFFRLKTFYWRRKAIFWLLIQRSFFGFFREAIFWLLIERPFFGFFGKAIFWLFWKGHFLAFFRNHFFGLCSKGYFLAFDWKAIFWLLIEMPFFGFLSKILVLTWEQNVFFCMIKASIRSVHLSTRQLRASIS